MLLKGNNRACACAFLVHLFGVEHHFWAARRTKKSPFRTRGDSPANQQVTGRAGLRDHGPCNRMRLFEVVERYQQAAVTMGRQRITQ